MFVAVRVRGHAGVRKDIALTMELLGMKKVNGCVVVPETGHMKGMLHKCKDYVSWGKASKDVLVRMLVRKNRMPESDAKKLVEEMTSGRHNATMTFNLSPPSRGYGSTKLHYPKGALGYRADKINELLDRMV